MRSGTLSYNRGLGASLIKRCWPLWTTWFVFLIIIVPLEMGGFITSELKYNAADAAVNVNYRMLDRGIDVLHFSVIAAPVAALIMFSFVFNSRGSGMIASLPVNRESVFITVFLTGLLPLLAAEVITALATLIFCTGSGILEAQNVWLWLYIAVTATIAYYGFAVFCSMLTGNVAIMPLAYILLGLVPYLAYDAVGSFLEIVVYGLRYRESQLFANLSPIVGQDSITAVRMESYVNGAWEVGQKVYVNSAELLGWYCVAGLLLSVAALLMFRKRRMESTGDIVAINVLKPVFRYCVSLGVAFVFALMVDKLVLCYILRSTTEGIAACLCLVVGAVIGYFAAEMLMQKTVKVFHGKHRGLVIVSAALLLLGLCCEFDLFGYEKYVPEVDEIEKVYLEYGGETVYTERENIEKITELHRQTIDSKTVNEKYSHSWRDRVDIIYELKNGREVSRVFEIAVYTDEEVNPNILMLTELLNNQEAIANRAALPEGAGFDDVVQCLIHGEYISKDGVREFQQYELNQKQLKDFYENCILPDAADGKMLRLWPVQQEEYDNARSMLSVDYIFKKDESGSRIYKQFIIYTDAERCVEWIENNTALEVQSIKNFYSSVDSDEKTA